MLAQGSFCGQRVEIIGRLGGVVYILETAKHLLSQNEGEEEKEI